MNETIRDCIGRLALLTYRIEAAKDPIDRERFTSEMNEQAARLNRLCNGPGQSGPAVKVQEVQNHA